MSATSRETTSGRNFFGSVLNLIVAPATTVETQEALIQLAIRLVSRATQRKREEISAEKVHRRRAQL